MFPQPASAGGRLPRARPTHAISSADILNFNRWAALQGGILSILRTQIQLWTKYPAAHLHCVHAADCLRSFDWNRFQLPKNFELRATQHQVYWLGRYSRGLGTADLRTNGPNGLYATFGVRWSFGGYGHQGAPSAY